MHCVKRQCYKISIYVIIKKYQSTFIDVICYEIKNILISNNNHKFKPTSYEYRIFYKTITIVKPYNFFKELIYMSFVYLFVILVFSNHDIGSQISPSLEMTNLRQESVGSKGEFFPFNRFFFLYA